MSIFIKLYERGLIKFGQFTLSSGLESPFYIDMRQIYGYPDLARELVEILVSRAPLRDIDVLAGVATAGIPLAAYISCLTGKPMAYVRAEKKNYGTGKQVEGDVRGKRVALVDDVATTGSSLLKAARAVLEEGGYPLYALVIVDREQGARELLSKHNIELISVITTRGLFRYLYESGVIDRETYDRVLLYLRQFSGEGGDVRSRQGDK